MTTVEQLLQWLRDSGVAAGAPGAPVVIQAYGKATKHRDWTIDLVGGDVVICADLSPRNRPPRCPFCQGTEFASTVDNDGEAYLGCVRCVVKAAP